MIARRCLLIGLALLFLKSAFAHGAQQLAAARVRLLPGSAFYERQEQHRTNYLASWNCDKLLFHYRAQFIISGILFTGGGVRILPG